MYDYREGELYEATKELEVKDIAAMIRKELRLLAPSGCKFSVRFVRGRGYRDIDIHLLVPSSVMALRYELEDLNDYTPFRYLDLSLMEGRFAPLRAIAQAYHRAVELFEAYNFYEAPVYGDGCSKRYFGGVSIVEGDL